VRTASTEDGLAAEEVVCDIKFVDYGGYMTLPASALRQIRTDFMMLPFQATECYLADVIWQDGTSGTCFLVSPCIYDDFWAGEGSWSVDATQCVETFARDQILQAQVVAYAENSVPYIRLYSVMQIPVSWALWYFLLDCWD
jgi:A-kinase anchor protein 1, mitochondrial